MAERKWKSTGVSQPGGSAQASEAARDSGVSQPADSEGSRILLVDAGWIRAETAKHLVGDRTKPVPMDEILETAEVFKAGCILGTDFPKNWKADKSSHKIFEVVCNENTSWHCWVDPNMWTLEGFDLQDLGAGGQIAAQPILRNRMCAILNLRYHDGTQVRVMVMKNLRGKADADRTLQMDYVKRDAIFDVIFQFLRPPFTGVKMVVGDLGMGMAAVHNFIRVRDLTTSVETHSNLSLIHI